MAALAALLAIVGLVLLTLAPQVGDDEAPAEASGEAAAGELAARREELLAALRDVEMDHAMGKIGDEDRERLRAELEGRAVRVLARLDEKAAPGREA